MTMRTIHSQVHIKHSSDACNISVRHGSCVDALREVASHYLVDLSTKESEGRTDIQVTGIGLPYFRNSLQTGSDGVCICPNSSKLEIAGTERKVHSLQDASGSYVDTQDGAYISLELTPASKELINRFLVMADIPGKMKFQDLHISVMYSCTELSNILQLNISPSTVYTGRITGISHLGSFIVLNLEAPEITSRHEFWAKHLESRFPDYIPHIAIAKCLPSVFEGARPYLEQTLAPIIGQTVFASMESVHNNQMK